MTTFLADGFRDVDTAADGSKLLRCLSFLDSLPEVQTYKERSIDTLNLGVESRAADLACGTGFDLLRMHRRAPLGRTVGFDASADLVAAARRLTCGRAGIEVRVADVHAVDARDGSFDAVRIDRSLQHIEDPGRVVAEMARLTRPGGVVAACEPDWSSYHVLSDLQELMGSVVRNWTAGFRNPLIGSQLLDLFADRGLTVCHVAVHTLVLRSWSDADAVFDIAETIRRCEAHGTLAGDNGARLRDNLLGRHARGRFCATLAIHCVSGWKD